VLEKLVFATLKSKSGAPLGHLLQGLDLLVIVFGLSAYFDYSWTGSDGEALGRHTALIEVEGAIESEGSGSAAVVIPALNKAFSDSGSVAWCCTSTVRAAARCRPA
jgi:protease-4